LNQQQGAERTRAPKREDCYCCCWENSRIYRRNPGGCFLYSLLLLNRVL